MNESAEAKELRDEVTFDRTIHERGMLNSMEAQAAINDGLKAKAAILWALALATFVAIPLAVAVVVKVVWL